ncbi:MAG: ATP synthase F1 subunit epsilon [Acidimicrobiia bacterium]
MTLHVEVVSPERILWTGEAQMVLARTLGGGDIAFLTGHAPFVGALDVHTVEVTAEDGGKEIIAVHGGFIEVSHDSVTVLSDVAELPDAIDVERAEEAKRRCEEIIARDPDDFVAAAALERANLRLAVAAKS